MGGDEFNYSFNRSFLPIEFDNHSVYLEDGTETVQDFGRVVAGVK